ncbi:MAG TPA: hypothetical protein VFP91_05380 [Vicinamibacterales bacterium]|nr:hypothetical protein [Vicinamibacterales bacterium]
MSEARTTDRVFEALDNRRIGIGPESWVAQVFAVYVAADEVWVQVAAKDNPTDTVILHLPRSTTTAQGALALWKWAQSPDTPRSRCIAASSARTH